MKLKVPRLKEVFIPDASGTFGRFKRANNSCEPLASAYVPEDVEKYLYSFWEKKACFQPPKKSRSTPYSIILPPPNVTGNLHLGHALTVTIQDTLARWRRMCGYNVVWIPGTDHAGIATQAVVEKTILKKKGVTRHCLGRKKLLEEIQYWKDEKTMNIRNQLKKLGASLDWSREFFTMDKRQSDAVTHAIISLHESGMMYRSETIVNWSCHLQSVVSDIEVDKVSVQEPTEMSIPGYSEPVVFGELTEFAYKELGGDEEIVVATSRVETMLGDTAIAVNPADNRYFHLHRSKFRHPITGLVLPVILDSGVDPCFGTGAVKITPAHDCFDFDVAKRHGLPIVNVIGEDGRLMDNCFQFSGMKRFDARMHIKNYLNEKGLLRGLKSSPTSIPVCSRSGDVIEYLVKPQWFIKTKELAARTMEEVDKGTLTIHPPSMRHIWEHWMSNCHDWCVSRQLWWGHQLPIYKCQNEVGEVVYVAATSETEAINKAKTKLVSVGKIEREPDVLDTWFSAALLPFSSLDWPSKSENFTDFYPLSEMITGHDILFFWVARMAMLGLFFTNQIPFKEVQFHGIICDSEGRKMSKSRGNVISPESVISGRSLQKLTEDIEKNYQDGILSESEREKAKRGAEKLFPDGIPACGADALRLTLLSSKVKNHYINFDVKACHGNKLFGNKLWQATKFISNWYKNLELPENLVRPLPMCVMDRWILGELSSCIDQVNSALEEKSFHLATSELRKFLYSLLCDVYLEYSKPILRRRDEESRITGIVLMYCLESSLRALAPFMPFITETLYQSLPISKTNTIMYAEYPMDLDFPTDERAIADLLLGVVSNLRKLLLDLKLQKKMPPNVYIKTSEPRLKEVASVIETLTKCKVAEISRQEPTKGNSIISHVNSETVLYLYSEADVFSEPDVYDDVNFHENDTKRRFKILTELNKLLSMRSHEGYSKVSLQVRKKHDERIAKLRLQANNIRCNAK